MEEMEDTWQDSANGKSDLNFKELPFDVIIVSCHFLKFPYLLCQPSGTWIYHIEVIVRASSISNFPMTPQYFSRENVEMIAE